MRKWENSGEEIWEEVETSEDRDTRKRGRRCAEVKAELGGSGGELWGKICKEAREELWRGKVRAGRKWGRSCEEVWKNDEKELWGKRGITRKWRKKWEEIREKLWWKFHWIYKSFLSTASICRPTEDSMSTLLPVKLDVCKEIHWGWQISATCLIFLYILPVVRKQLKHFHNKWIRNTSSILSRIREVSVWIIYKYAQSFTRVDKSFSLLVNNSELCVQHMNTKEAMGLWKV